MNKYILAASMAALSVSAAAPAWADCASVGKATAAEQNGRLINAAPSKDKDGKDICVVVISVPSTEGEKPRRVELAVPLKK